MNKLKINKQTISQMENHEMNSTIGGIDVCVRSCANGTRRGKRCCDGKPVIIDVSIVF
ncbi:hypothetical protein ACE939_04380 [Aquimarina sp. W85]|uniref:hypothetical protein n=1 Tax=Aquimarina rhodophyticola TaxID=3342246 RepID=UPI00366E6F90